MAAELVSPRLQFVRTRLLEINKQAGSIVLENGLLLREYKANGYYKEDGFESFEAAIQSMQDAGQLDYGPRNARNFIAIVDMVEKLALDPKAVDALGISKLREVASLSTDTDQRRLLAEAPDMSVSEVQSEAKKIRDHAKGYDVDPLVALPFKLTVTQKEFLEECIIEARRLYVLEDEMPAAAVLVDSILADWFSQKDSIAAVEVS